MGSNADLLYQAKRGYGGTNLALFTYNTEAMRLRLGYNLQNVSSL